MDKTQQNSVLIVDDEKTNLEILINILTPEYRIYTAKSGTSAIEMANEFLPDIILLDIIMPDMDGYAVLAVLKSTEKTKNIPVIFITALEGDEHEEKGLALEAADFIHKPFYPSIVKLRVHNQIQMVNQIRSIEQNAQKMEQVIHILAATEEKSNFFAKMSHEMRTPLNAVICLSEIILEDGGLNDEAWENVEKIGNAGSSLLSMVNDILDITKIEANKFNLFPVEYNTLSLINDAVTQSMMHKEDKQIEFILNIDEKIPAFLNGDDVRIKQILNNLLSNAFKYTREGTVELNLKCEKNKDTVWLIVSVKDTGVGITSENLENMFSDYSRMDMSSNRKVTGTGLGLSITKMLLNIMGGTINVESEYGKGSVFTVKFPQAFVSEEMIGTDVAESLKNFQSISRRKKQKSRQSRISLPYARVLVVDDILTNLHVAKGMMKPYRMEVDTVTSGQEAIDAIREAKVKYNAIFMDHMMPKMDGMEAVRIIRNEIGTVYARNVPIIAFTANALSGNEEMFLSNGFNGFLTKPIEIPRLDAIIRQWVRDEEQEKKLEEQKINVGGEAIFDPRKGQDRRTGGDRREGFDRRLFEERIEGMDMRKGLERFSGDRDTFLQILMSFSSNTRCLLDMMKDVNESNLADYAINVHGIKSSCRGICAEAAGNKAEALENAAKSGDLAFVKANNPAFIESVFKLTNNVEAALAKGGLGAEKKDRPKKDKPYNEALLRLQCACDNYQIEEIEAAIKEIEVFEYTADENLVLWLRENVDQMNYLDIVNRLSSI